jgi:formylglycine-generating enzyme required for sulfatase activity/outer membrane biosynthesis protein TonB
MAESFDAYHAWLGIAPKDQPPNHYRLLGVDLFEDEPDTIQHAADRQMAHLRTFQTGRHSAVSQRLLNEVAAARLCLLKPDKKAAYDADLRKHLAAQGEGSLDSGLIEALRQAKPRSTQESPPNLRLFVGIASAVLIAVLLAVVWLSMSRSKPEVALRPTPKPVADPIVVPPKAPPVPVPPAKPVEPAPAPAKPTIEEKPPQPAPKPPEEPPSSKPAVVSPQPPTPDPQPLPSNSPPPTPAPESPTPKPQPLSHLPLPEGAALDQATKAATALFQTDIERAKTPADKLALAKRLLAQSLDQSGDAAGRYALLRMAGELAVGARDAETAFQCVDQIDAAFQVDRFAMKTAILTGWAKEARSADARKWLVEHLFTVGDEALDAGNVDAARELGKLATSKSAGLRDKEIAQRLKTFRQRFTEAGKDAEELQQAQAFLAKDPRHAQSNLVVGRYLCFTKADWKRGLPLLALASDETLKRLAAEELAASNPQPPTPNPLPLADAWWEISLACRRSQMNTIKVHAGQWYRQALASLPPGLVRSNVEKRLAELKKLRSQSPAPPPAIAPFDAQRAREHQERWAAHLGEPVQLTNSIGMKLALIPPGEFDMGSTPEEIASALEEGKKNNESQWYSDRVSEEGPRHRVKISRPYYVGVYPVTQGEYEKVMGVNPSSFCAKQMDASAFRPPLPDGPVKERLRDVKRMVGKDTSRYPVETVSWADAVEFCRRLSELPGERAEKRTYRLPAEAEWEYACRAGTTTRWWCGDDEGVFQECAWYNKNADAMTHPVGEKRASPWGLYDMHGQVWQWCLDWHDAKYYGQSPGVDPTGPPRGANRVGRGGHLGYSAPACRSAYRSYIPPRHRGASLGFRVCLVPDESSK